MPRPDPAAVAAYITSAGEETSYSETDITGALAAEARAQARRCRVPAPDAEWPEDLAEALCRRVLVNLALRAKPLGVEAAISEAGVGVVRYGGRDPEVRRLEATWRRRPVCG